MAETYSRLRRNHPGETGEGVRRGHPARRDRDRVLEPTTYEIVIRGRVSARVLLPMIDDFVLDRTDSGVTRLRGVVRDAAHLHGLVAHLGSVNAELVSITPLAAGSEPSSPSTPSTPSHRSPTP
jgi:hypothetical protein